MQATQALRTPEITGYCQMIFRLQRDRLLNRPVAWQNAKSVPK